MSQGSLSIPNSSGAAFRAEVNTNLQALGSCQSGATAPTTTYAYMLWADTANALLKQRDGSNAAWITLGALGTANLGHATLASPTFTGTVTIPSGASISGYLTTSTASSTYAPLASPTLTGTPAAPTATAGTNTTQLATTAFVAAAVGAIVSVPSGSVSWFAGSTAPSGYLSCDGSAISRTTYATLFAAIGTTHGAGNGSTTFNIPDLRGEFIRGLDSGRGIDTGRTLGSAQASSFASHTHAATASGTFVTTVTSGASSIFGTGGVGSAVTSISRTTGSASVSITATGGTDTLPRNIALLPIIKY